jgi:N-acetyl-gamma-glutamyl-phosphate/LysW-gamma-L-alpha-aminoadipyl-6-phosphate reductase
MLTLSIVGAAGYAGGELLRLVLGHPELQLGQAISSSQAGSPVHASHPNLRGHVRANFEAPDALQACDVLVLAGGHGTHAARIEEYAQLAPRILDLSADFRLRSAEAYEQTYGRPHPKPEWLERFVYGLPELHRDQLRGATHVSGVGCNATAMTLALLPLARLGLVERALFDLKVGSSEGGAVSRESSHHPERSGTVRPYATTDHRHLAEVRQALAGSGDVPLSVTAHAIEMVRGVACTAHVFLNEEFSERQLWGVFREHYGAEPFVRLVAARSGQHRYPEPKLVAGSNHCDIGFAWDAENRRAVVFSALDNLVKGAAGSAIQSLNLMAGWDEHLGLGFPGLHPN